jgi:hypothetical protein
MLPVTHPAALIAILRALLGSAAPARPRAA